MSKQPTIANEAIPEEERQPTRRGVAETTRTFDQTFLRPDAEIVHRDYAAHFFRWGFAKKNHIVHEQTDVLDVGCGPDRPMLLALFGGMKPNPLARSYTGVDLNKIKPTNHARSKLYPNTNFIEEHVRICEERGPFGLITNFEVIEHMPVAMGRKLVEAMRNVVAEGGKLLLSTPVYDGKARAKNHIHEYTIPELQSLLEDAGWQVIERWGTFANIKDLHKVITREERQVMDELSRWYSNDVLSCFLAPLYPDASRNNLWECVPAT